MTGSAKRYALLVSTTACVEDLARHLGSADYSYGFVWRALEPLLTQLGSVRLIARPESQLSFAAAEARAVGLTPVHIAVLPPHLAYFPADVTTVLFPFWEFPDVPDRPFGFDSRQDWTCTARGSRVIVAACNFTARALRHPLISRPVQVVPVPLDPAGFEVAPWDPNAVWEHNCRHLELTSEGGCSQGVTNVANTVPNRRGWKRAMCATYSRHVRPWLSDKAVRRAQKFRQRVLRIPDVPPPLLPRNRLTLSGLIYLSIFNLSDRRKNPRDLITGFLTTFRDRPDVTLVLKLATSPATEHDEVRQLREMYSGFGLRHQCRLVAITDYLERDALWNLYGASTYYVNTSRAEGACLPLQEALAAGRPAIAPGHTAMADYMDEKVGFPVESSPEPTAWPHDPSQHSATTWARLSWLSLAQQLRESARIAMEDRRRYDQLATAARTRMRDLASREVILDRWRCVLAEACRQTSSVAA